MGSLITAMEGIGKRFLSTIEPITRCIGNNVFGEKLDEVEVREAVWNFTVLNQSFGVLPPVLSFWNQLTAISFVQGFFVLLTSGLTYCFIIKPSGKNLSSSGKSKGSYGATTRKHQKQQQQQQQQQQNQQQHSSPSIQALLVGYGIVLPLCIYYPRILYQVLDIRNYVLRFAFVAVPTAGLFRCTEAIYGFAPNSTTGNYKTYFFYWLAPVEQDMSIGTSSSTNGSDIKGNNKMQQQQQQQQASLVPAPATRDYFIETLVAYVIGIFKMSIILSAALPFNFYFFPTPTSTGEQWTIRDYFSIGNMFNNFIGALLFQQALSTFGPGLSLIASSITGLRYKELMGNPMFQSSSPSEFWGRRWNRFVHSLLKRGVYKPVRSYYNGAAATVAAFVVSGLFHEWVLWSVFGPGRFIPQEQQEQEQQHTPTYGMQTKFFIWNAMIITLEHLLSHWLFFQSIKKHVPLVGRALLTASLSLPVAHWFLDEYHKGNFFADMALAFPIIIRTT